MFELSDFYDQCKQDKVDIIPFLGCPNHAATVRDDEWLAVFLDFERIKSTRLLRGICYHESGHVGTGALHKVYSPYETVERAEHRANRWAAEHYLTADDFRSAFADGYTELWELAEYFDLPEDDIKNALHYWTECRGVDFNEE